MRRVVLAGPADALADTLAALQALGTVELDPLAPAPAEPAPAAPAGDAARRALRHLLRTPGRRRQRTSDPGFDVSAFVADVVANARAIRRLEERREALAARIADVAHWGDFAFPDSPEVLGGNRLWFYIVPNRRMAEMPREGFAWRCVSRTATMSYVVVVSPEEPDPSLVPAPRVHVGSRRLADLVRELETVEADLDEARLARQAFTARIGLLARSLAEAADADARADAARRALADAHVFVLVGWTAAADLPALEALADARGLALLARPPLEDEVPPTRLDPPPPFAAGADLVTFYQAPPSRGWDPSVPVFLSFALFFAIIVSDAGYALVLGAVLAFAWRRLGRGRARRFRPLLLAVVGLSLAWGVAAGSWFGLPPPAPWLARLQLLELTDFRAMLGLSLWIGIGHLGLAIAGRFWSLRGRPEALAQVGWLLLLAGAVALWQEAPAAVSLVSLAAATLLLLLHSDPRRVRSVADLLRRLGAGLAALSGVSRLFADVLSYLRLFALGLASASLALAFNGLAADLRAAIPGFGLLAASLVLLAGHGLNLALAIVGGTVHGLRLNYIEFGSWAEAGEGRPFRPFARHGVPS